MPIRFRCVYCDKLLGIARRKAGAVVNCPQCQQPLIVPSPEPEPTAAAGRPAAPPPPSNPGQLFEQDDFDVYLEPAQTVRAPEPPSPSRPRPPRAAVENTLPPQPFAVERDLPPTPLPRPARGGLVLSPGLLIFAIVMVLFLIGTAFAGGLLVGRMMNQS